MSPDLNEHVGVTFGGLRRVWRVGDLQQNRHFQARSGDSLPPRKKNNFAPGTRLGTRYPPNGSKWLYGPQHTH